MSGEWGMLLAPELVRALADRSIAELEAGEPREDERIGERYAARYARAEARLGALASTVPMAAALLGAEDDLAALDYVAQSYEHTHVYDERWDDDASAFAMAITHIATLTGEAALEHAEPIVTTGPNDARLALAEGLAPHAAASEAVRAMLGRLHALGDDRVRAAASKALGGHAPPPWAGVFPSDPLAALPPDRARALRAPLDRVLSLLGAPHYQVERARPALRRALRALPDALALPLMTRLFARQHFFDRAMFSRWALSACAEDVESDARLRLEPMIAKRARDLGPVLGPAIVSALSRADASLREAVAQRLMKALPGPGSHAVLVDLPGVIAQLLPDDFDPRGTFEELAGTRAEEAAARPASEGARSYALARLLGALLRRGSGLGSLLAPALDALAAGWPGAWSMIAGSATEALLASDDTRVRRFAEASIGAGSAHAVRFALRYLMRVAGRRGGRALLRSALSSARIRAIVAGDRELGALALPGLRAALRSGALETDELLGVVAQMAAAKRAPSAPERAVIMRTAEALAAERPVELAKLLVDLARLGLVEPDHPLMARLERAWREGGPSGSAIAHRLVVLAMDETRATWAPLVERIASEHPDARLRRLAERFLGREEDEP